MHFVAVVEGEVEEGTQTIKKGAVVANDFGGPGPSLFWSCGGELFWQVSR